MANGHTRPAPARVDLARDEIKRDRDRTRRAIQDLRDADEEEASEVVQAAAKGAARGVLESIHDEDPKQPKKVGKAGLVMAMLAALASLGTLAKAIQGALE